MNGTETSTMLADQLDRLFSQSVDRNLLSAFEDGKSDEAFDRSVEDLGLAWALVGEEAGGAGLGWADVGGLLETIGYHAAPYPIGEQIAVNQAIYRSGMSLPERTPLSCAEPLTLDTRTGRVSGSCIVAWSGQELLAALANCPDGSRLCLLPLSAASQTPLQTVGRDPRFLVHLEDIAPADISVDWVDPEILSSALAVVRAGQIAGALSRILEMSIEYGNTRVQFGRPIGKFQAVQHMIAELSAEAAAAKAGLHVALRAMDASGGWKAAAIAKIRASLAAGKGAMLAHEVHGAIGVTEEHMLHHLTRRLWQWRDEAGSEHEWSEKLGRYHLARGGASLWPDLVAISDHERPE